MVHGNPDMSTDVIHLSRSFSHDSDEIDGKKIPGTFAISVLYETKLRKLYSVHYNYNGERILSMFFVSIVVSLFQSYETHSAM